MKNSRKPGRPADHVKRGRIIEVAAESFFDVGFAATSIEQIASDAGVSKVTIYNHFGDKHGLFAAAVERECEKMGDYFSIEEIPNGSIGERLTTIGTAVYAFLSRPEMIQFERRIAAETEREPGIGRAFLEAGPWRMKEDFSSFLAHATDNGELNVADTGLAAEQFVSMCKGMGDLEHRFGEQPNDDDKARRISGAVEVFLAAYGMSGAR